MAKEDYLLNQILADGVIDDDEYGTVQGMILTFQALAQGGAGDASMLANSIGQALWTTAGGLIVSIPSITVYYSLRNKANRLIMRMTALTMELLKGLRNVEVVDENAQS